MWESAGLNQVPICIMSRICRYKVASQRLGVSFSIAWRPCLLTIFSVISSSCFQHQSSFARYRLSIKYHIQFFKLYLLRFMVIFSIYIYIIFLLVLLDIRNSFSNLIIDHIHILLLLIFHHLSIVSLLQNEWSYPYLLYQSLIIPCLKECLESNECLS